MLRQTETYIVVWSTLASREDRRIDPRLHISLFFLAEEDQARPRPTKGLVRGRSDHIAELEGRPLLSSCDET